MSDNPIKTNEIGPNLDQKFGEIAEGPKMNDFKPTY